MGIVVNPAWGNTTKNAMNTSGPTVSIVYTPKAYVVYNYSKGQLLESYNANISLPIASITKLMTAVTFYKTQSNPLNCTSIILDSDRDFIKNTKSRLPKNIMITCRALLMATLISSDNTAAHALAHSNNARDKKAFITDMNYVAKLLNMSGSYFMDSSGLSPHNKATVFDLIKLAHLAMQYDSIREISTAYGASISYINSNIEFRNTNRLITRYGYQDVLLSKTGYIRESGFNLLMVKKNNPMYCTNGDTIMVISLGHPTSNNRFEWTKQKFQQYCQNYNLPNLPRK